MTRPTPRPQHYLFAHHLLRQQAMTMKLLIGAALGSEHGPKILADLWDAAGDAAKEQATANHETPPQPLAGDGLSAELRRVGDRVVTVVTCPPTGGAVEAHKVAIVSDPVQPVLDAGGQPGDVPVRYFTLEQGIEEQPGVPRTALCEWAEDGTHLNYGTGPAVDDEAFIDAALSKLDET